MTVNIAFYTQGDNHVLVPQQGPNPPVLESDAFRHFARRAAPSHFYTATEVGLAMIQMAQLRPGSVRHIYFFGHGAGGNGDFIFDGRRNSTGGFVGTPGGRSLLRDSSDNASRYFILRLAQLASRTAPVVVHAQFCWSAQGRLLPDIADAFGRAGVRRFQVLGIRVQGFVRAARAGSAPVRFAIGPRLELIASSPAH